MITARTGQNVRPAFVTRRLRQFIVLAGIVAFCQSAANAASVRTRNFIIYGPDSQVVTQVARAAEDFRHKIAMAWLGKPLAAWPKPCPVKLKVTGGEAGGVTSFSFDQGRVTDQEMNLEGSAERILKSALPHEITHTIFAWHFGSPMPRWADEGACMLSEDDRELARQDDIIRGLVERQGHMPLGTLFKMEEYPKDLLGFYGQGYSVSRFLIEMGGREAFLKFVGDGMKHDWDTATRRHYNLPDSKELDRAWRSWHRVVALKRPPGQLHPESTLAATDREKRGGVRNISQPTIRAQSDDSIRR